jgi:hypothetical protein
MKIIKKLVITNLLFLAFNSFADPFDAFKEIAKELDKSVKQKEETPKQETPKQETPKQETKKQETPKQETPKQETQKKPSDGDALQVAYDKGMKFAKESGVKWQLYEKKDELSGEKSSIARLNFKSSGGAALTADLKCDGKAIEMTLTVASGIIPSYGKSPAYASMRVKTNETITQIGYIQSEYKNVFFQNIFEMKNGRPYTAIVVGQQESVPAYVYIADVPTNMGNILIKVPPYDNAVYALGQTCK